MFIEKIKSIAINAIESRIDHNKLNFLLRTVIQSKIHESFNNKTKEAEVIFSITEINIFEIRAIETYLRNSGFITEMIERVVHKNGLQEEFYRLIIRFEGRLNGQ